ncbi:MAG: deoxyribose-phosphate aldolase, partial [Coriobacteriia bacterium]|nr:deoxyribose-phosphate aldolase [Coriobacteriia bacterium]
VDLAAELLTNVAVRVVTVVNFPHGDMPTDQVLSQIDTVVADGVDEIDYVMDVAAALRGDWETVEYGISAVVARAHENDKVLKVILETCLLDDMQITRACQVAQDCQADYVKTSTGFSTGGATVDVVRLMRSVVGESMGIKASGGIRYRESALALVSAGADRIGTSSALKIIGAMKE